MSRKVLLAIVAISLGVAAGTWYYGRELAPASGAVVRLVTALSPIQPYVVITPDMLVEREMPEPLIREPVFQRASEVAGKIAAAPIPAGALIYRDFVVPAESFRLTSDPALEVLSFPARPEKAVGGQLRPGQRINIYRVAIGSQQMSLSPEQALSMKGADAQIVASGILVVDARTGQGESPVATAVSQDTRTRTAPPTIISVAVTPELAKAIVALVGETRGLYDLWVTLAPLDGGSPSASVQRGDGEARR